MAKFKIKKKDSNIIIDARLKGTEQINVKESEFVAANFMHGFFIPQIIKNNRIQFSGPDGISLYEYLNNPLDSHSFYMLSLQVASSAKKIMEAGLSTKKIASDVRYVFVNAMTGELWFIYLPVVQPETDWDIVMFLRSVCYCACANTKSYPEYVYRFDNFLTTLRGFDYKRIEDFIRLEDPSAVIEIQRKNKGNSGFMTNKRKEYYDHYDNRTQPGAGAGGYQAPGQGTGFGGAGQGGYQTQGSGAGFGGADRSGYQAPGAGTGFGSAGAGGYQAPGQGTGFGGAGQGGYQTPDPGSGISGTAALDRDFASYDEEKTGLLDENFEGYAPQPGAAPSYETYAPRGGQTAPSYDGGYAPRGGQTAPSYDGGYAPQGAQTASPYETYAPRGGQTASPYGGYAPQSPSYESEETTLLTDESEETTLLTEEEPCRYPTLTRLSTGEFVYVDKPVFRVGKERSYVDFFIANNSAVSRSHADIICRDGRYFIKDLNSKNRTFINDRAIQPNIETEIFFGDSIRLANEEFSFKE